jgi:predicted MFS family arabinose efflux permease
MDILSGPGFRLGRHPSSVPERLPFLPRYSNSSRNHRMWLHTRFVVFNIPREDGVKLTPEGSLYTLSTFYKRSELATVTAVFFLGNTLATATSGLLAYGILPLGTRFPEYYGWQWLMLIEGSMAIFVACLIITFLPGSPASPRPLFLPIRYFTEREERILAYRVILDDSAKADSTRRLAMGEIFQTLGNWRIWPHVLMAIAYIAPTAALGT